MMKRSMWMAGILAAALVTACVKPERESAASYLANVEVKAYENPLRIPLSLTFSQPCSYQVEYWKKDNPDVAGTTSVLESEGGEMTATVMFLYPDTVYEYRIKILADGQSHYSETAEFKTGSLPVGVPEYKVDTNYPHQEIPGYVLQFQASEPGYVTFCDTDGNVVWFEKVELAARQVTYDHATRTLAMNLGFKFGETNQQFYRLAKKIVVMDLEGNRLVDEETGPDNIEFAHHEIKRMPDGNFAMLCNVPKVFDLTSIGGKPNTTLYGDGLKIVTPDFKTVLWEWDCFRELDPLRDDYLDAVTNRTDLIHANSIGWDAEGNLYYTINHLSELWKIDRKTGDVIYRVGEHGNMTMDEKFYASGLHAAEPLAPNKVLCLDNGSEEGVSRTLIYEVNPEAKTARASLAVAFPSEFCTRNRGNVLLIHDGSMLFYGSTTGYAYVFADLEGNILKVVRRTGISYRTYYFETIEY